MRKKIEEKQNNERKKNVGSHLACKPSLNLVHAQSTQLRVSLPC